MVATTNQFASNWLLAGEAARRTINGPVVHASYGPRLLSPHNFLPPSSLQPSSKLVIRVKLGNLWILPAPNISKTFSTMLPPELLCPALGLGLWTLYCSVCLARNYLAARKTGLPIRVIPIDHTNAPWTLLDRKILSLVKRLPGFLGKNSFTRYNYRTWELHDRYETHHEVGDVFIIVTPGRN